LLHQLQTDRAALRTDIHARSAALHQLAATELLDLAAYQGADRELNAQRHFAHARSGQEMPAMFSDLEVTVKQMLAQVRTVELDLKNDLHSDFAGIAAARAKIAADRKALKGA